MFHRRKRPILLLQRNSLVIPAKYSVFVDVSLAALNGGKASSNSLALLHNEVLSTRILEHHHRLELNQLAVIEIR